MSYLGIDVAKDSLELHLIDENECQLPHSIPNTTKEIRKLFRELKQKSINPVFCMESTGCYSKKIAKQCLEAGQAVTIVNPYRIKKFGEALGKMHKTDAIDAEIIAKYAQYQKPQPLSKYNEQKELVKEFKRIQDSLTEQLTTLKNQIKSVIHKDVKKHLSSLVKTLKEELEKIKQKIAELIAKDPEMQEQKELLMTIPGIAEGNSSLIIAEINDIKDFRSARALAAYIGVVPRHHQSGVVFFTKGISRAGNRKLREKLYLSAMSIWKEGKHFRGFIERLEGRGKAKKQILCAIIRKLAHTIYGILKHKTPFSQEFLN